MPKIVYVERSPGPHASIEKVFREIASHLPERFAYKFQHLPYGWKVYESIRNLFFFKPEAADIYHITGHVHFIALRLPPERTVLSIMDVRFVLLNRGIKRWILKKLYLDLPLARMKHVTAISEKIKDEIVDLTGCEPAKIRVLGLPLMSHISPIEDRPFNAERPTILQVGTMMNKNVTRLAEALNGIPCTLVIVGELSDDQRKALSYNGIVFRNVVGIDDDAMRRLYDDADIVTFCSTYEGFGLPIIEAQAMRKPLVTSNLSPLREVAGEGACLVDPFSVDSIRSGVLELINRSEKRRASVEAGQRNVRRFSPRAISAQYAELYDELLESIE